MSVSQIESSDVVRQMVDDIHAPITPEVLIAIKDRMYSKIQVRPYDNSSQEHEKTIRWKRTATEIVTDGYVYDGKSCTDLVVVFLALCNSLGLQTRFVKLKKEAMVHSIAEVKLDDGWYIFDVSRKTNTPIKGEVTPTNSYADWHLWKKGRDAWDLGLVDFDSISNIH